MVLLLALGVALLDAVVAMRVALHDLRIRADIGFILPHPPRAIRAVDLARFSWLARCGRGEVLVAVPCRGGLLIDHDLAEGRALSAPVGRRVRLPIGNEAALEARGGGWLRGKDRLHGVLVPPAPELVLVQVQPVLLRTDYHARPHKAHIRNQLVRRPIMPVKQVRADQAACPPESSLAVHGNPLPLLRDRLMRHIHKLAHQTQRRARPIVEDHVDVADAQRGEVARAVELRVESHDEADVALDEVGEHVLEGPRERLVPRHFGKVLGEERVLGGGGGDGVDGLELRGGEGEEVG